MAVAVAALVLGAAGGEPVPWQINLQPAATPVMEDIRSFNFLISIIIVLISAFVLALLAWTVYSFHHKRNPIPSKTTHNALVEVIWTVVPILILVLIVVPSFKLLYKEDVIPDPEMTIKAIGHQWYWTYEYPDHGGIEFDSFMVPDDELLPDQPRLLATDTNIVLPVDTIVRILVTADDVIHSWTIPAFGSKIDAVPGRINETWVNIQREGLYYGQCSELCGVNHGFMPIAVEAVSKDAFEKWVAEQQAAAAPPAGANQIAGATAPSID
ncbi:MAG: cytochrome c oxidase subunit II [Alphaproteobacteria bacterium]|nr:cytochrome c oxidase subunit II [Alphaproteobacteria bacterium]